MQFTIIRDDNRVIIDGEMRVVDCSALPPEVHAVQWSGDYGEIEYRITRCAHCGARTKKGNEVISDAGKYESLLAAWRAAKAKEEVAVSGAA